MPANGSPANRCARKAIPSGKNLSPASVWSEPAYSLSSTGSPWLQYWCASAWWSFTIITSSPVPSWLPTPISSGAVGRPGALPMISLLMVRAIGLILRKAWYFFLTSCCTLSPG